MVMQSGSLRELITIKQSTETLSDTGYPTPTWTTFTQAYASLRPIRGREDLTGQQVLSQELTRIIIRYVDSVVGGVRVCAKMRVVWLDGENNNRYYDIRSVLSKHEKNEMVELTCTERLQDATAN